jgi:uncharacterized short protein YbdD (DUF466 family)
MKSFLRLLFRYLNGDFAYENYLKFHNKTHPETEPLNRKTFLKERAKKRQINRCC